MMTDTYDVNERGVVEVLDIDAYTAEHPAADVMTCGVCGRSWDDAVISGLTPVPSGRCPFESDHDDDNGYGVDDPEVGLTGEPIYPDDDRPPLVDTFTLTISLGSAAMQTPDQVAVALREVAERLTGRGDFDGPERGGIRDDNGNTVGGWEVK